MDMGRSLRVLLERACAGQNGAGRSSCPPFRYSKDRQPLPPLNGAVCSTTSKLTIQVRLPTHPSSSSSSGAACGESRVHCSPSSVQPKYCARAAHALLQLCTHAGMRVQVHGASARAWLRLQRAPVSAACDSGCAELRQRMGLAHTIVGPSITTRPDGTTSAAPGANELHLQWSSNGAPILVLLLHAHTHVCPLRLPCQETIRAQGLHRPRTFEHSGATGCVHALLQPLNPEFVIKKCTHLGPDNTTPNRMQVARRRSWGLKF